MKNKILICVVCFLMFVGLLFLNRSDKTVASIYKNIRATDPQVKTFKIFSWKLFRTSGLSGNISGQYHGHTFLFAGSSNGYIDGSINPTNYEIINVKSVDKSNKITSTDYKMSDINIIITEGDEFLEIVSDYEKFPPISYTVNIYIQLNKIKN